MSVFRVHVGLASLALLALAGGPLLAQTPVPQTLSVPLFPEFDLYGNQFEIVQAYENELGQRSITAGIYDTGASLVSFSVLDQEFLFEFQGQPQIPTIPGAVATADAIGGTLTGKVSAPGKILAAGASALNIDFNTFTFDFDLTNAINVGGIQAMIGTTEGSPNLPSIVGTPINIPSASNPSGLATVMDQIGYALDLSSLDPSFAGIPFNFPDVRFEPSGSVLAPKASTYEVVDIPLSLFGVDTTGNPGNDISSAPNPMQHNTGVTFTPSAPGSLTQALSDQSFLFDTGAQISVISSDIAFQLGLIDDFGNPIETPFDVIDVQGAGEKVTGLNGFILDTLSVPRLDGGMLEFTDVPVYVLDVGFGIDGILGMNLFNGADSFMYDPYNVNGPRFSALFLNDRSLDEILEEVENFGQLDELELALLSQLGIRYAFATPVLPGLHQVPEPSTLILALMGLLAFGVHRRWKFAQR
jgi:hypothetical protein